MRRRWKVILIDSGSDCCGVWRSGHKLVDIHGRGYGMSKNLIGKKAILAILILNG